MLLPPPIPGIRSLSELREMFRVCHKENDSAAREGVATVDSPLCPGQCWRSGYLESRNVSGNLAVGVPYGNQILP
jgi:hypothetical protein